MFEKIKEEIKERGYSKTEMERTKRQIERRWADWRRNFHSFLEILVHDGKPPNVAVGQAEQLADLEEAVVDRRKPQGLEEE